MPNLSKPYLQNFQKLLQTILESWQRVDLSAFEKQKQELDKHRPFSKLALKSLEEKLEIDEVHNSTAIEGNSLTLGETALVLQKGLTVSGKPLKDHLEVKGYDEAYKYIKSIYKKSAHASEELIKEIHRLIFRHFDNGLLKEYDHGIGFYRKIPVYISGSEFVPPNYIKVPELMNILTDFLSKIKNKPIIKSAIAHYGLAYIHPFVDGNGRTARLLMNFILFSAGYPIVIVKNKRRPDYLKSLEALHYNPKDQSFLKLMLEFLQENLNLYQEMY